MCRCTLEAPPRGTSNEYPEHSCFVFVLFFEKYEKYQFSGKQILVGQVDSENLLIHGQIIKNDNSTPDQI